MPGLSYFVSPAGSDSGTGSIQHPFASLERARSAIRDIRKKSGALPSGGVEVCLREGVYSRMTTFQLEAEDSGTAAAPIVYRAFSSESVSIVGGIQFHLSDFSPVNDPDLLARLPEAFRGKVMALNLKRRGITDFGAMPIFGHSAQFLPAPLAVGVAAPELFVDKQAMTLARWPNEDYAVIDKVVELGSVPRNWQEDLKGVKIRFGIGAGTYGYVPPEKRDNPPKGFAFTMSSDRLCRWTQADDLWMFGYWFWDWSDQSIKVQSIDPATRTIHAVHPSAYGIRSGQRFYVYNLLEEIDQEGEWYLDRKEGVLYFYPPAELTRETMTLSLSSEPLIQIRNASHIQFSGLKLGFGRSDAVRIQDGSHVLIDRCDIGNMGGNAVVILNGKNHQVKNCYIHDLGAGGVSISGGDRQALTPSGHAVLNSHITRFSRITKTYTPGILMEGVGGRAVFNKIHDAPHCGILFRGNDHLIEFNDIHDLILESDDMGAVYAGRSYTMWGNSIRHNYFHDIMGFPVEKMGKRRVLAHAVYLDDGLSGVAVNGNVFLRCNDALAAGGSDNQFNDNLVIDCRTAFWDKSEAPGMRLATPMKYTPEMQRPEELNVTVFKDILSVPYASPVWREKYPDLVSSLEETVGTWRVQARNNLLFRTPPIQLREWQTLQMGKCENNLLLSDIEFPQEPNQLYAWIAELSQRIPGFKPIPFGQMGLAGAEAADIDALCGR